MSDDIYEDPDSSSINIRPCNNTENIYMNAVPKRSQQRMKHSEIQDHSGGQNHGPYKLAVVFLGLLCVLLLAVITGLCIKTEEARQLQVRYTNLIEEKDQLQLRYTNLIEEKDQLEILNNNLIGENRRFLLESLKSLLETNVSATTGERDELQYRLCKHESDDMKRIKSHAVDVTLDPDTAHRYLILSADGKQVRFGGHQNVPDNPKRFGYIFPRVLGKQGFSTGKFYYEVQVKGKTDWILGVARESVNRTGDGFSSPEHGYWPLWLYNGTHRAQDSPYVLSLKEKPQRVGVFVDYEAGLVSFYDADCWYHLYSYVNVTFTEKLYPFFNPGYIRNGMNSAPLIISSVHICPI